MGICLWIWLRNSGSTRRYWMLSERRRRKKELKKFAKELFTAKKQRRHTTLDNKWRMAMMVTMVTMIIMETLSKQTILHSTSMILFYCFTCIHNLYLFCNKLFT